MIKRMNEWILLVTLRYDCFFVTYNYVIYNLERADAILVSHSDCFSKNRLKIVEW